MSKHSRNKGNSYERRVAKLVMEAFAFADITRKDCYRTPLSGGHPVADAGDLTISDKLWRIFPFAVECKHVKNWHPGAMFLPRKQERNWLLQVKRALPRCRPNSAPLLALSGNGTGDYMALPLSVATLLAPTLKTACPRLYFLGGKTKGFKGQRWIMARSTDVLKALADRVRIMKEEGKKKHAR